MIKAKWILKMIATNDKSIRSALRGFLEKELQRSRANGHTGEIFEELGVQHGTARIDFAIVNGTMCGYEIKSDLDSLGRLPDQVSEFNCVFDELTLVVGKRHLYRAMHMIPDWWGVIIAKKSTYGRVILQEIRPPERNKNQKELAIVRLLWRSEALKILEYHSRAEGVRHKPRDVIYKRLAEVFSSDSEYLKNQVRSVLITRGG